MSVDTFPVFSNNAVAGGLSLASNDFAGFWGLIGLTPLVAGCLSGAS